MLNRAVRQQLVLESNQASQCVLHCPLLLFTELMFSRRGKLCSQAVLHALQILVHLPTCAVDRR